jgi:hypothetical protein
MPWQPCSLGILLRSQSGDHPSIGRCKKEKGDHPKEGLAKSGYEPRGPNMKHKSLINHHSIFLATY